MFCDFFGLYIFEEWCKCAFKKQYIYFVGNLKVTEEKEPDPDQQVRGAKMSSDPEHCKLQCHKSTPQGVYTGLRGPSTLCAIYFLSPQLPHIWRMKFSTSTSWKSSLGSRWQSTDWNQSEILQRRQEHTQLCFIIWYSIYVMHLIVPHWIWRK